MSDDITKIKFVHLTSNNICFGLAPDDNTEVEQYLKIEASGEVSFSARNYKQYNEEKGYCREKHISIDKSKVEYLFQLIENIYETDPYAIDVGSFNLVIFYDNGSTRKITGSLIGNVFSRINGEESDIDLNKVIRRSIPIRKMWVFNG